jgi:hypothetical protein
VTSVSKPKLVLMVYPQAITEAQAKMELAKDEERRLAAGGELLHATSASSFIVLGLEIEETQ